MDCGLLPYKASEWSKYGSPLKLWDYLYAGPPIAGSGYSVLASYPPPLVHFASDSLRLVEQVDAALAQGHRQADQRRSFALANTWTQRGATVLDLLEAAASRR